MKVLLILWVVMIGCGVDPDDYRAEEADGCRSDDVACQEALEAKSTEEGEGTESQTDKEAQDPEGVNDSSSSSDDRGDSITVETEVQVKTKVVVGPNGERISEENADNCQAGRFCRGSTKAEVLDLLGEPNVLTKEDPFETWEWAEWDGRFFICGSFTCTVKFRDGLVVEQDQVNSQWLDLLNF